MLFGLPWFAIIAIVAIGGGLLYAYKEQELKVEEKRFTSTKESQELRKMILNLKTRVEHLETIATEQEEKKGDISLDHIEIKDEPDSGDSAGSTNKVRG